MQSFNKIYQSRLGTNVEQNKKDLNLMGFRIFIVKGKETLTI